MHRVGGAQFWVVTGDSLSHESDTRCTVPRVALILLSEGTVTCCVRVFYMSSMSHVHADVRTEHSHSDVPRGALIRRARGRSAGSPRPSPLCLWPRMCTFGSSARATARVCERTSPTCSPWEPKPRHSAAHQPISTSKSSSGRANTLLPTGDGGAATVGTPGSTSAVSAAIHSTT